MKILFSILTLLSFAGCSPTLPRGDGSVLIISIPSFRADDLGCVSSTESSTPHLDSICAEAVRFTHAYTPSVLSNPALASVLTGLYPVEHGIHRNGASRYTAGVKSLAEHLGGVGYQTLFVSGGVPAFRKSAVSQGFHYFDDSVRSDGGFYRTADGVVKRFFGWIEAYASGGPVFGVLQMTDLMFSEIPSEFREGSFRGKLQEIDDAIGKVQARFKKMGVWDPLTVVILGLQGSARTEHEGMAKGLNLFDEVVRIPLLIKPGRKPRDQGPSWKVDDPISLVDLGKTLFALLKINADKKSAFPVVDFLPALEGKDLTLEERPLFCESDLPVWRGWGPRLLSVRLGEWVLISGNEHKLFNTYTDRLQLHDVYGKDRMALGPIMKSWREFQFQLNPAAEVQPTFLPLSIHEKLKVAKGIFSKSSRFHDREKELLDLRIRRPADWQVVQWAVKLYLELQNWPGLRLFLRDVKPVTREQTRELELWRVFSLFALKLKEDTPRNQDLINCFALATALKRSSPAELQQYKDRISCPDLESQYWVKAYAHYRGKRYREAVSFFENAKALTEKRVEQDEFARAFWIDGATWDFDDSLPAGPSIFEFFTALVSEKEFLDFIKKKQLP
jgi:hypothetical protein